MKAKAFGAALAVLSALVLGAWFPYGVQVTPPGVTKNIVTDYGAACNGDIQRNFGATVSTVITSTTISSTSALWNPSDIGKHIWVRDPASALTAVNGATITAVAGDGKSVTINSGALFTFTVGTNYQTWWGTNDIAAFLAFQTDAIALGATPVTLSLNNQQCQPGPNSAEKQFFKGIQNLVVDGGGPSASIYALTPSQPLLFGGNGQRQNSRFSVRTDTANAGDSCVTLKTQPQTNVTNVSVPAAQSTVTASQAGFSMVVTAVLTGPGPQLGQQVFGAGSTVGTNATIRGTVITACPGGVCGGTGTYTVNTSLTLPSQTLTAKSTVRYSVASTSGYTDGDAVYFQGVSGTVSGNTTTFSNAINNMQWVRVIDGTTLDAFQIVDPGSMIYTSGGTAGGDRTSLFPVGSPVLMTGWINQAYWQTPYAFPSNPHFFEYKIVTSTNSSTHEVCFDTPLANTYKSTWPQYNTGSAFEVDPGGPATLYAIDPTWELNHEYKNFAYSSPNFQNISPGRTVKWTNVTTPDYGTYCMAPSQNVTYTWQNVSGPNCDIETDKIVTTYNLTDVSLLKMNVQSSSILTLNATRVAFGQGLFGSPKNFVGNTVSAGGSGLSPGDVIMNTGVTAYGRSDTWTCNGCSVAAGFTFGQGGLVQPSSSLWTYRSDGVIVIPNWLNYGAVEIQVRGLVPGTNFILGNPSVYAIGQVTDVTQDFDNIYVATSFTSGFPSSFTPVQYSTHPAPKFTCVGCSGELIEQFNGCTAELPLFSCLARTFTGSATGTTVKPRSIMWGYLSSLTMNVTTPYGGAGNLSLSLSQFNNWSGFDIPTGASQTFGSTFGGGPSVNMKIGGSRTVTTSGVTGAQSLDSLFSPGSNFWFRGQQSSGPVFSANTPSDSPVATVTITTNQGVVYP